MRYIAAEDVAKAKEMDLLTYLRNYEPQELVCVSGNTYCTREHDSLRISNGKWCWFSRGIGGRSALDYLIKVKGIPIRQTLPLCDCDEHKRVQRYATTCRKAESEKCRLKISGSSRFRNNPQRE